MCGSGRIVFYFILYIRIITIFTPKFLSFSSDRRCTRSNLMVIIRTKIIRMYI